MNDINAYRNKIICGNTLDVLKQIPDDSVDCIITSPPYWGLRFYGEQTKTIWGGDPNCQHEWGEVIAERVDETGFERNRRGLNKSAEEHDGNPRYATTNNPPVKKEHQFCKKCGAWYGQLGLEPDLGMYLNHLLQITAELKRVLKSTGVLFWVHGDCYGGSGCGKGDYKHNNKRSLSSNLYSEKPNPQVQLTPKCLALQNWRLVIHMIDEQGWILRNEVIWHKLNAMPSSVKDRLTTVHEPVFFFTKSQRYFFDLDSIRVPPKTHENRPYGIVRTRKWNYNSPYPKVWKLEDVSDIKKETHEITIDDAEIQTLKEIQQYSGSPGRRAKLSLIEGKLTTTVRKKLYDVGNYLKTKLKEANLNTQQLAEITGLRETTIAHYFRTDLSSQAIPDRGTWEILKPILKLGNYDDYISEEIHNALPQPHPLGKNPGDVWTINTQPAPPEARGKHFAMFPEKLVQSMILAGCPREVCKKCGKPRLPILKSLFKQHSIGATSGCYHVERNFKGDNTVVNSTVRIGWTDCGCGAGFEPGIVLDPFAGSGTTCVVAKKLGYDYIGIEINPEYCEIARIRLEKTPRTLALDRFTED